MHTETQERTSKELSSLKRWIAEAMLRSRMDYRTSFGVVADMVMSASREWAPCAAGDIRALWQDGSRLSGVRAADSPKLYMHFPYCLSQCAFCDNETNNEGRRGQADFRAYVEDSLEEARYFAPLFEDDVMGNWEIGGGSPSLMDAGLLRHWLESVAGLFRFQADGLRYIEIDPTLTTPEKLSVLKSVGFNYLSLGVQTFNTASLRSVNRGHQTPETVSRFFRRAREAGFNRISGDLLLGLKGETASDFILNFRRLAGLGPSVIAVFGLDATQRYLGAMGQDRREYEETFKSLHAEVSDRLPRVLEETGFRPFGVFPQEKQWLFVAKGGDEDALSRILDKHSRPSSELAIGWHGQSKVFGRAVYKRGDDPFSPVKAHYRQARMPIKAQMANAILRKLQYHRRLKRSDFRDWFGSDVEESFSRELSFLRAAGLISEDDEGFVLHARTLAEAQFAALFFMIDFIESSRFSPGPLSDILRRPD